MVLSKFSKAMLFVSPPCPSAKVLTTLIARWGRLGYTEVVLKVSNDRDEHVDDPTFVIFVGD